MIGVDESGKGDYFGPLVIAGVFADRSVGRKFEKLNVKDSKLISDNRARELSREIKKIAKYSVVVINPARYNELYGKLRNLNKILAWGHSRVIENLLNEVDCNNVISDKFGDEKYIKQALMEKGRKIKLKQETKAEKHLPVAAASIIARAEYLDRLDALSAEVGCKLHKGATEDIEKSAKELLDKYGKEILSKVAKVHFKTTKKILAGRS